MAGERLPMNYPYTLMGKISRIPFMYYVKSGRGFRYYLVGLGIFSLVVVRTFTKGLDSPANKAFHEALRNKRDHHDAFHHVELPKAAEY